MEFIAGEGNTTAGGFQLSLLSVPDDLHYIIAAATGQGADSPLQRISERVWGNNKQDKELVSHLLKLLATNVKGKNLLKSVQENSPLIVVLER